MSISFIKKSLVSAGVATLGIVLSVALIMSIAEPLSVGAAAVQDQVTVTLNVTTGISITSPADVSMSTNLGVSANTAVGTTTWNVKTNNSLGYTLAVHASTTPAMQSGGDSILDYQTGAPNTWSATTSNAYFGYSGFGTDVPTGTWGSGSFCNGASTSTISTTLKYKGFTTSDVTVATRSSTTTTSGVDTTICFAVEQNNFYVPSGTYTAVITATATTL